VRRTVLAALLLAGLADLAGCVCKKPFLTFSLFHHDLPCMIVELRLLAGVGLIEA